DERAVLRSFFEAANGQQWENKEGWGTTSPLSEWFGVTVAGEHVVRLNLHSNGLKGSIPAELGQLSSLQTLHLEHNQLSGE
ncbi:unnamed protein product, partial [Chrysoparadoxa australica]